MKLEREFHTTVLEKNCALLTDVPTGHMSADCIASALHQSIKNNTQFTNCLFLFLFINLWEIKISTK